MDVETIATPDLGDRSYLVHHGRRALVVDPQRDIDRVLAVARRVAPVGTPVPPRLAAAAGTRRRATMGGAAAFPWHSWSAV